MLAKAHVTIGMAAAFTIARPETVAEALPVIVGGALGCLICDLDCEVTTEKTESSRWRKVMAVIAIAGLIEDYLMNAGMWDANAGIFDVVTKESKQQYLNILNILQDVTVRSDSSIPSYVLSCCVYKLPSTESLSVSVSTGKNVSEQLLYGAENGKRSASGESKRGFFPNLKISKIIKIPLQVGTNLATLIKRAAKYLFQGGRLNEYFLLPEVNSLFTEEQLNTIRQYIKMHKCVSGNDLNEALASKNVIMIDDQALYPAYMLRQLQDRGCAVHTVSLQTQGD